MPFSPTKLQEYIADLKELKKTASFPIGAVIIKEADRAEILGIINSEDINIIKIDEADTNFKVEAETEKIISYVREQKYIALDIRSDIPGMILNQLTNLADHQISSNTDSFADGSFILLIINDEQYQDLILNDIVSSFCKLTN